MGKVNDRITLLESQNKDKWTNNERTFENILSNCPAKLISSTGIIYEFLKFQAIYQQTNQPLCTPNFIAKALHIGKPKIKESKKVLIDLGLIEEIPKTLKSGKEVSYTRLNYFPNPKFHNYTEEIRDRKKDPYWQEYIRKFNPITVKYSRAHVLDTTEKKYFGFFLKNLKNTSGDETELYFCLKEFKKLDFDHLLFLERIIASLLLKKKDKNSIETHWKLYEEYKDKTLDQIQQDFELERLQKEAQRLEKKKAEEEERRKEREVIQLQRDAFETMKELFRGFVSEEGRITRHDFTKELNDFGESDYIDFSWQEEDLNCKSAV